MSWNNKDDTKIMLCSSNFQDNHLDACIERPIVSLLYS